MQELYIDFLNYFTGKVRKLKNHLTEFGSTNAMVIQDSLLISSGYDLDKGTGYLNGKTNFVSSPEAFFSETYSSFFSAQSS